MDPEGYDQLSFEAKDSLVADGEGKLTPALERHIIAEGDEFILFGGITAGRFSSEGLQLIAEKFPEPGGLWETVSYQDDAPLPLIARTSMLMLLEPGVRNFCRRMGRSDKAESIIAEHFGSGDLSLTLQDVWKEPMFFPDGAA